MRELIHLSVWQVAGAAALVLVAGGVSLLLRLRLERTLATAVIRSTVQLLLVGYVLHWLFANVALAFTLGAMAVMTAAAAQAALSRAGWKLTGSYVGAFVTLTLTAVVTALFGSGVLVRSTPWYAPRYALPLLGMLLGNGLTGVSLALDSFLSSFADDAESIELELALGATRWEAARAPLQRAVRRGMIPIINAMMVVGVVSLPGMMTGQILAGTDPIEAVKYQLLILFLIAASTSLACVGMAVFAAARMIDRDHRIRRDRLQRIDR